MTTTRRRLFSLPLLAAVTLATGLTVLVAEPGSRADDGHDGHGTQVGAVLRTPAQVAFHDEMRKLWEDHVTWTRLAIVSFAAGLPDLAATEQRLLANQADIGDAVKPFYGEAAGNTLTRLLRVHITTAVTLLTAAKAGDPRGLARAQKAWYANANDIADFLSTANPRSWPRAMMRADMRTHLDQTLQEAVDRLHGDFAADVADYEQVHRHILEMADMLSTGIMRQFPASFR